VAAACFVSMLVSLFQSAGTFFLAKITEQGIGASRARLALSGWATSVPYPCAQKMAKVDL
jgi:hypothetical protein